MLGVTCTIVNRHITEAGGAAAPHTDPGARARLQRRHLAG